LIVFAGPSIAGAEILFGLDIRPPAKQGDVYLATLEDPDAIGIIDGYFDGVPSVWHKEILWSIAHDIPIFGASSMGALRAAELDYFGMIGVGSIYEGYRDGVYEDDDEVALHHAPAEVGYTPLSIAMVNVRATIEAALRDGIITPQQHDQVIEAAKALYYGDRNWPRILADVETGFAETLKKWLPENEVDQKKADALLLLNDMAKRKFSRSSTEKVQPFLFEQTRLWRSATEQWKRAAQPREAMSGGFRLLADEP